MAIKLKVKKGDEVVVIAGREKGKKGKITKVMPTESRVVVGGVNLVKRNTKASQTSAGGIIEKEASLHISNVSLIDPKSGKPTRAGYKLDKDGSKTRIAKRSGEAV
ncbi:MAG: 50S ribosomal protein L24 [Alphaproteobacteria bacterium]|nr:50S ribosomal protein L24 [Alphaproteobacteria bacterium]